MMQKVKFKKIRVRNFLSYGKDPVEFNYTTGLSFVTGFNKDTNSYNGVGKTTLLVEAISFVISGDTHRKINLAEIVHRNAKDGSIVEFWFTVGDFNYKITRSIKPSNLILLKQSIHETDDIDAFVGKNRKYDISRTITETTKDIEKILGISPSIFSNTLVMTNDTKNKFLGQSKDIKSKFVEGILSLEVFSKMLDKAKKEYNDHNKLVDKSETVISELKKSIISDEKYRDDFDLKAASSISRYNIEFDNISAISPIDRSGEITELLEKIRKIQEDDIPPIEEKLRKAADKKAEIYGNISVVQKQLDKLTNIKFECPTCKRPMGEHDKSEIDQEKNELSAELSKHKDALSKLVSAISKTEDGVTTKKAEVKKFFSEIASISAEQDKFNNIQKQLVDIQKKIEELSNSVNPFADKIKTQQERLDDLQQRHTALEQELRIKDAIRFVVSGQGVKSTVVKKILDTLNNRLEYYLKKLNSPYMVKFNEFFEEEIVDLNGRVVSFGNASAGEAKRIDFALLFAFRDIRRLQSGVQINLSVFDELFDSSICNITLADIFELLTDMATDNDECFYVITHRPEAIPMNADVIRLEKENDITKIIDIGNK